MSNDVLGIAEELLSTTALQEQSAVDATTTAEHAARLGLPRISTENAAQHPPPSLNAFRTAAARAPANSVPALWFWQMTGEAWPRDGYSFDVQKKRHRRMVTRQRVAAREENQHRCAAAHCSVRDPVQGSLFCGVCRASQRLLLRT